MKKKLKLDDLKVKSFVTSKLDGDNVKGGTGLRQTMYSCDMYITCDVVGCVASKYDNHCYLSDVQINDTPIRP